MTYGVFLTVTLTVSAPSFPIELTHGIGPGRIVDPRESLMLNPQNRRRFQELRGLPEPRSAADQAEFDALVQEVESAETTYLSDATQRMRGEREQIESRNQRLQSLVTRRKALADRLGKTLAEAQAERQAIETELATVLIAG
jgi:hypothetical protein